MMTSGGEEVLVDRQARIQWISLAVNNVGTWQQQIDHANVQKIHG